MPKEKLYVSVYEQDDEAYDIWTKHRGVDPSHMVRLGKADNVITSYSIHYTKLYDVTNIQIPDLVNSKYDELNQFIFENFEVIVNYEYSTTYAKGIIISQDIKARNNFV